MMQRWSALIRWWWSAKWQDVYMTISQFGFFILLFPTIFGTGKPSIITSLGTCILLATSSFALSSLRQYVSASMMMLVAFGWFILFIQSSVQSF